MPTPVSPSLPERRSSLVGREADVAEVVDRLHEHRLVTLTGAGGVGKTSVAVEVGRRMVDDGAEVHLVDLAASSDDDSVELVVADQVGLSVAPDATTLDTLVTAFTLGKRVVLLLDNCEHVRDQSADLVDELLLRCPALRILATSRVRLEVDGEVVRSVEPLAIVSETEDRSPALDLMVERARAAGAGVSTSHDVEQLGEVAARLDGVPLAIELAAARLATMSIGELLSQLDAQLSELGGGRRRVAERHRSLGAVVEWSFELLDAPAREVFARLSVFAGGFDRDAAVEVAGPQAASLLHDLVEVSLLQRVDVHGTSRFRMLEMIRAFASGHLDEREERHEVAARHARWAAHWALDCQDRMRGPAEAELVPVFRRELPNIGAALRWAAENDERALVADLACALGDHIYCRAGGEVHAWVAHAVATLDDPYGIEDLVGVAAMVASRQGDLDEVDRLLVEAEKRGFEGPRLFIGIGAQRGFLESFRGRISESSELLQREAEGLVEDFPGRAAMAFSYAALPLSYQGEYARARDLAQEGVTSADASGWPTAILGAGYVMGEVLIGLDPPAAIRAYRRVADIAREVDNRFFLTVDLVSWASAVARHGDPAEAFDLFDDAVGFLRTIGGWSYLSTTLRNLGELLVRVERYEESLVIRTAVEHLAGSTVVAGVDAGRDEYLKALLQDRILPDRHAELVGEARDLSREAVVARAVDMIDAERAARRAGTAIRAVVFTDLENATAFMADLGDQAARSVMRRYEELTQGLLTANGGKRVKGTGDGMLLTFASVSGALRCVQALLAEVELSEELPLRLRVGVHAGEMIDETESIEGDDVHGTVVNLAARVVDEADGGEVVVTDTARQIVVGSGFDFTSLGEFDLKGIRHPTTLFRLERSGNQASP